MTVPKLELHSALLAAGLKNENIQALTVTVNHAFMWTDSTTVLQWKILEYISVDKKNHVPTKNNPAEGMSADVLQLSSWVKRPHFITNSRFLFVPRKDVINNIELGVIQAVIIEDTVSLSTFVKKRQLAFLQKFRLICLVLIKKTCACRIRSPIFAEKCRLPLPRW